MIDGLLSDHRLCGWRVFHVLAQYHIFLWGTSESVLICLYPGLMLSGRELTEVCGAIIPGIVENNEMFKNIEMMGGLELRKWPTFADDCVGFRDLLLEIHVVHLLYMHQVPGFLCVIMVNMLHFNMTVLRHLWSFWKTIAEHLNFM